MKTVLLIACIGHILCGICDCLLGYSPDGRLDLKGALKSPEKMREVFSGYPVKWAMISIMLGVYAITAFGFGYLSLSRWMEQYSATAAAVMYISAVVFLISIVVHHIVCGLVEWLYVRLGRTDEAREAALEFQMKTIATMIVGYVGLASFLITLIIMVITGRTSLPQWACVINTLPLMILLLPTKLPAKGNIAGAIMYLGLFILL
ncbi:MAG: hypothetical protein IJ080_03450 [Oscillospiraceae bacterium]|nr:hypothetical protein [Oscillospiraceae bacterium]MBQ8978802.1 hypothetical protein [Oscillospiraceae bacterium]